MKNGNLVFAPKDTKVKVDSKVLVTTGVSNPMIATVKHINHNEMCYLDFEDEQYEHSRYRHVGELKPLMEDPTSTVGEVIQQSGDGRGQYDWVKTVVTEGKFVTEMVIGHDEYAIKKKMQDFKAKLSVELRSEFVEVAKEWGDFNRNEAEKRAAEEAAGEDL